MEEFIDELNLPFEGEMHDGTYVIKLNNSNEYSKLYNIISTDKQFTLEDGSIATTDNAMFVFHNDWYELKFTADFNKDIYRLVVSKR